MPHYLGQLENDIEHVASGPNDVLQAYHTRMVDGPQKLNLNCRGWRVVIALFYARGHSHMTSAMRGRGWLKKQTIVLVGCASVTMTA